MVWNNPDPTKVGRIANREAIMKKFPAIGKGGKIEDYNDVIAKKRAEAKSDKNEKTKIFFINCVNYYSKNYEKATLKIDETRTLDEILMSFTETQLFEVQKILDFCHDPRDFNDLITPRLIVKIKPDHEYMQYIISKIKKLIPAFEDRVKLARLDTELSEIEKKKLVLQEKIKKAQLQFESQVSHLNFEEKVQPKEKIESLNENSQEAIQLSPTQCRICYKECNSPAGLASHTRTQHRSTPE